MEKLKSSVCNGSQQVEAAKNVELGEDGESPKSCKHCQLYDAEIEELEARCRIAREKIALGAETQRDEKAHVMQVMDNFVHPPQDEKVPSKSLAAQTALANSAVVRKILEDMNEVSLLPLRRVSKLWENVASTLILESNKRYPEFASVELETNVKRTSNCVRLAYNKTDGVMGKMGMGPLEDLIELIRSGWARGRLFPSSRFAIKCPHLLACPQLTQFLIEHGHLIQSLLLLFSGTNVVKANIPPPPYSTIMESIRNLLFKWAVNIEYLHLGSIPWPKETNVRLLLDNDFSPEGENSLNNSTLLLPNLKVVNLDRILGQSWNRFGGKTDRTILQDILTVAPNLENVKMEYPYSYWDQLVAAEKTGAVKHVKYSFCGYSGPWDKIKVQAFIAKHYKSLEDLQIKSDDRYGNVDEYPEGWRPPVERLNEVLENNKNTLKKISCAQLAFHPGLRIPQMSQMKELNIKFDCRSSYREIPRLNDELYFRMFPQGIDATKIFPNLTRVTLEILDYRNVLNGEGQRPILPALESLSPLTTVRSLFFVLAGWRADELVMRAANLMPQVKYLKVKYDDTRYIAETPGPWGTRRQDSRLQAQNILAAVWRYFDFVETIDVELYLPTDYYQKTFVRDKLSDLMDSGITGLDVEMVKKLRKGKIEEAAAVSLGAEKRDQPSILNMKYLKNFKLSMNKLPMFSHISVTHGFSLMKDLTVVVHAKHGVKRDAALDDPQSLTTNKVRFTNGDPDEKSYFSL